MDKSEIYAILNQAYFSDHPHEEKTLRHLTDIFRGVKCFVDVGASLGQYTRWANQHMRNGRIIAIEADPVRFEELERNCRRWAAESSNVITPIHGAAAEQDGEITFYTSNSNLSGGLYPHDVATNVEWEPVTVPAHRLDTLTAGASPDLVKVDVEGGEYRVVQGATGLLRRRSTAFMIEVHPWTDPTTGVNPHAIYGFLSRYGYHPIAFHGQVLFAPLGRFWLRHKADALLTWLRERRNPALR